MWNTNVVGANRVEANNLTGNLYGLLMENSCIRNLIIGNSAGQNTASVINTIAYSANYMITNDNNTVGTIVGSMSAMNAASNGLVNIAY